MESPTTPNLLSSTTLSLLGVGGTNVSLHSVNVETQKSIPAPTTTSSQSKPLTSSEVKFAEEPIHLLLGKNVKDMTDVELAAHCEYLRSLRKSPQTLVAKVKKDEELLDGMYGESDDKKIRRTTSKTLEEKTKKRGQTAEVQGGKLANKWALLPTTPAPTPTNQ